MFRLLLILFLLAASFSYGDTYNFNFGSPKSLPTKRVEKTPPAPAQKVIEVRPEPEEQAEISAPVSTVERTKWFYTIGAAQMQMDYYASGFFGSVIYSVLRSTDVSLFTGSRYGVNPDYLYLGAEIAYYPIRISFSDSWDFIRLGVLAGTATPSLFNDSELRPFLGIRATLGIGPWFGFAASVRSNRFNSFGDFSVVIPI